ncbi:hypothetical protein GCM10007350_06730 [Jeongeupia chitinilytica]|uniref:Uncharacterized protein n=1 Tax=Jeongeupia chitinilytica TaxID=1041641 RepID=A0ABQ3GVX6_9NEIS|nr:hypothetical protein GCM10007350_06730 [Jeongeupia chitinilytica]
MAARDRRILRPTRLCCELQAQTQLTCRDREDRVIDKHGPKTLARYYFRNAGLTAATAGPAAASSAEIPFYVRINQWVSEVLKEQS